MLSVCVGKVNLAFSDSVFMDYQSLSTKSIWMQIALIVYLNGT